MNDFLAHKFVNITYRTPAECDLPNCSEGQLWGIVRAPQAVACQKCNQKYHAACVQPNSPAYMRLPPCRGIVAEEMLVLAPEISDQSDWLRCLLKKIEKTPHGNTNNQQVSKYTVVIFCFNQSDQETWEFARTCPILLRDRTPESITIEVS